MGFKFYRRIKLGKGLGLNISRSGISPSIRTKKGSINPKGYSIRTGIKGVNYQNSFSKKEAMGCLSFFAIIFIVISMFKSKK
ncbi:DUF4236 domain-containing protein [Tenacibaculum amylolyticum]|uniref:DUF4236 domain-containing protein n=1 Tax=Tenacibaculum amylolyticum TaxID=104269 RepID=UPI003893EC2C